MASKSDGLGNVPHYRVIELGSKASKIGVESLPDFVGEWSYSVSANGPNLFFICRRMFLSANRLVGHESFGKW